MLVRSLSIHPDFSKLTLFSSRVLSGQSDAWDEDLLNTDSLACTVIHSVRQVFGKEALAVLSAVSIGMQYFLIGIIPFLASLFPTALTHRVREDFSMVER